MSNNITKTIQESLNTYLNVFGQRINRDETITDVERLFSETQSHLLQSQIRLIESWISNLESSKKDLKWFEDNWFIAENAFPSYDKIKDRWVGITAKEAHNSALEDQVSSLNETLEELKKSL